MLKIFLLICVVFPTHAYSGIFLTDTTCTPVVAITTGQNNSCPGSAVTFRATVKNEGTNGLYKWKKNNIEVEVNATADYTATSFRNGDVVTCEYSCKTLCGLNTTVSSNSITVHVVDDITPTVTVANYDSIICEGELTVFRTTAFYGNALPSYHWTVNGSPVGTDSPIFSTSSITNGSRIECLLTISTPSCGAISRSATSQLTIYVYPMIHPAITIKPGKTRICRGEEVTFTATANGGAHPALEWAINGTRTGANAAALTTSTLKNGDTISCTVTIDQDSRCHTSTSAPSNKIIMEVQDYVDPALKISSSDLDVCAGTNVTFTATPQNAGSTKFYQWQVNSKDAGSNSSVFNSNEFTNGDKVSCILTTDIAGCPITAKVSSNTKVVTVKDAPVITFVPPQIEVLEGEQAEVNASVMGNIAAVKWSPADLLLSPQSLTSSIVALARDTIINLTVTGTNGCAGSKDLVIKILHKLNIPSAFTPNEDGKNDIFRIPLSASISLQKFTVFDRWGNVVFKTSDITKGWNGTYRGNKVNMGTYIYLIKGIIQGKPVTVKGTVILIR